MRERKIVDATFQRNKKRHFQEPWNIREVTLSETAERTRNQMKHRDTKGVQGT